MSFFGVFDNGKFSPHGFCISWDPFLIWSESISDILIAGAYFSIPLALIVFLRKRRDIAFRWVFFLFAAFIVLCGITHVLGAITLWKPVYELDAIFRIATAIVSVATATALWPLIPRAVSLPNPATLRAANTILAYEVDQRRRADSALRVLNEDLEARVAERTASLTELTYRLEGEIQDRKAAESQRKEAAELLESTFGASPFPIIIYSLGGDVIMCNQAGEAMFGYSEAELMLSGFDILIPEDERDEAVRVRKTVRTAKMHQETRMIHRDGHIMDIRYATVPIFHDNGAVRALVMMLTDETQAKRIEAQLFQSQKMEAIGTLTGGLAHDFNNLLGIVIGNLDMMREIRPGDGELDELACEALDAALRGADLTRSLLAFARRQPLHPRHLDLDIVVGGLVKMLTRLLGSNIEITLDLAANVCPIVADPAQLEAALTNLATNARDAMKGGGKLAITTGHRRMEDEYAASNPDVPPGDYAMIEVTDTGEGMDSDTKNRIFEPFFTTKDEGGTGLGLSMVFGFMKQSNGHIAVYSEVGVGTTFRLYFPCSTGPKDAAADLKFAGPAAGAGETILAVEDSAPLRRIVVLQLRGLGYNVLEANDGVEALAILETEKVDLLFTDVVMPGGIDGIALAKKAMSDRPGLKVILTSGFPQIRFSDDMSLHNFSLLSKPYRKEELALLVRAVLDGRNTPVSTPDSV